MDKNTIIGFLLIAAILFGFSWLNKPSEEQKLQAQREQQYSNEQQQELAQTQTVEQAQLESATQSQDAASSNASFDSFGAFAVSAEGAEQFFVIENEVAKITFTNKGGRIYSVELKNYRTYDSLPLALFDKDESNFAITLADNNNRVVNTSELYFVPVSMPQNNNITETTTVTFRLKTDTEAYLDYVYTISPDDYMLDFSIQSHKMNEVLLSNTNSLDLVWNTKIRQIEIGRDYENRYTYMQYKFQSGDVEKMSEAKNIEENVSGNVKWIAFKRQFFSSILISHDVFSKTKLESTHYKEGKYLKDYKAYVDIAFDPTGKNPSNFKFYFGPNQYKILNAYNKGVDSNEKLQLQKLVPLGWGIFGWINQILIIPMFNLFGNWIANFGIVILLMTICIKMLLFPLTFKSYQSTAKMRVLKPQIDEINARIPADKMMERQRATQDLYKRAGVNVMGGCLPTLLQMPFLVAMFWFFPASIELRQQSFLWASDLSSYDSIFNLPFSIPFYGDHVSLFCLLMAITNLIYTHINMANTMSSGQQMPGMKMMMYLMPVMFLFIFNGYASGLSYYYFISTLITIGQTYLMRLFIDEKALLAKLNEKVKNNKTPKKSGFMARLEEAQRKQMEMQRQQAKGKKKK